VTLGGAAAVTLGGAAAGGRVTTWRVEAQGPDARNDFDRPDEVTVADTACSLPPRRTVTAQ
jgi:hypothetical protein